MRLGASAAADRKLPATAHPKLARVKSILNVSAYKFVELVEPAAWRDLIRERAIEVGLKGTVLLAKEGINLFAAAPPAALREFIGWLIAHREFEGLPIKESWSDAVPFGKLIVKVKAEIIRMNHPTIRPQAQRAPAVDAATLARWLDQGTDDTGRPAVMLDTRNAFEVRQGTFRGALDWQIDKFSQFPEALQRHRAELANKTVVSFCTGGIRCEKAAIYMQAQGVECVYQLDGGILKYFELVGDAHYHGNCFVFDTRETLDAGLQATRRP